MTDSDDRLPQRQPDAFSVLGLPPAGPQYAEAEPPPTGLHNTTVFTAPPPFDSEPDASNMDYWRDRYVNERRRSKVLMIVAGSLAIMLLGAIFYGVNAASQSGSPTGDTTVPFGGQQDGGQSDGFGNRPDNGAPGFDRRGPGDSSRGGPSERFFSEGAPGEALQGMVEEFTSDSGFLGEQLRNGLDSAVDNGLLSQEEADSLLADLGFSPGGTES
ncbi:MAG: hypothetical protein KDC39_08160 [Actinobacteria bacterium]|nr:hypothetical protein [Actinomycetota bacterium]